MNNITHTNAPKAALKGLFEVAYRVARKGRPYSDCKDLIELEMFHRVNLLPNNVPLCWNFLSRFYIVFFFLPDAIFNTDLREKLERAKSVSVLCHGSTESAVVEKECFYWLHVATKTFYPTLSFLSLKNLSFHDTEGIKQAIKGALDTKNLSNLRKKIVFSYALMMLLWTTV